MRTIRAPLRIVVPIAVLAVAVAGAAPSTADVRTVRPQARSIHDARRIVPAGAIPDSGDPGAISLNATIADAIASLPRPDAIQVVAHVARARLGRVLGVQVPELFPGHGAPGGGPATAEPFVSRIQFDAGDLDGSGATDVVESIVVYEIDWELLEIRVVWNVVVALNGSTGAELWRRDFGTLPFAWPAVMADVTGDGRGDVVLLSLAADEFSATCVEAACTSSGTFHWTMDAITGGGTDVWTKRFDGKASVTVAGGGPAGTATLDVTNVEVLPLAAGDLDADRGFDLAVSASSVRRSFAFASASSGGETGTSVWADQVLVDVDASVLSGATGASMLARNATEVASAALLPAGGAVGDATDDLVWTTTQTTELPEVCASSTASEQCDSLRHSVLRADMIDGATWEAAWSLRRDAPALEDAFVRPLGEDLTGDRRADLLLGEWIAPKGLHQGVVSGASGTQAWSARMDGTPIVAGPIAFTPAGSDLLVFSVEFASEQRSGIAVSIDRVDGATGAPLLRTEREFLSPQGSAVDGFAFIAGDADGDAVVDAGIDVVSFPLNGDPASSYAMIESGADGRLLFNRTVAGLSLLAPAGDIDGDGDGDILDAAIDPLRPSTIRMFAMPEGDPAWTLTLPGELKTITPTADLFGTGGADALCLVAGPSKEERFDSVDQRVGVRAWGAGDPIES